MEINVLESTNKRLVFELKDADNTFCNILKKQLNDDKAVLVATYSIRHPLVGVPKFIIETTTKTPKKALNDAISGLTETNKDFLAKFKRQVTK
ncbi:MAG: DNA-directed RNA polymerase subunit L [Nanoarchaeota archaeon]|nr:DNA-directed RNA polymerase subunit L [Nanoarchaeota archaeon]MBU1975291.1 DNA-directed RNA polymerase subunit L [Nanoarchaeota archaeon]